MNNLFRQKYVIGIGDDRWCRCKYVKARKRKTSTIPRLAIYLLIHGGEAKEPTATLPRLEVFPFTSFQSVDEALSLVSKCACSVKTFMNEAVTKNRSQNASIPIRSMYGIFIHRGLRSPSKNAAKLQFCCSLFSSCCA